MRKQILTIMLAMLLVIPLVLSAPEITNIEFEDFAEFTKSPEEITTEHIGGALYKFSRAEDIVISSKKTSQSYCEVDWEREGVLENDKGVFEWVWDWIVNIITGENPEGWYQGVSHCEVPAEIMNQNPTQQTLKDYTIETKGLEMYSPVITYSTEYDIVYDEKDTSTYAEELQINGTRALVKTEKIDKVARKEFKNYKSLPNELDLTKPIGILIVFDLPAEHVVYYDIILDGKIDSAITNTKVILDPGIGPVANCSELQNMSDDLGASWYLTTDIDCSGSCAWNGGTGFAPVSTFTGSFDGRNHTITNFCINNVANQQYGLFGAANGATISNVGMINVSVVSTFAGANTVGALIGTNEAGAATITNVYSTGVVTSQGYTGGLVGDSGTIDNCWSTANITGSANVGGLMGLARSGSHVGTSYATGSVTGSGAGVGGLVGQELSGSYVANSWASGIITAGSNGGGITGTNGGDAMSNNFWFNNTGDDAGSCYIGGDTGCTTKTDITYFQGAVSGDEPMASWDFAGADADWVEVTGPDNFPLLIWDVAPETSAPTIAIVFPTNTSYAVNVTELNITCADANPSSEWYSIGVTNYTSQAMGGNFTSVPYAEGPNTIVAYCNDTGNRMNATSVSFSVDSLRPTVNVPYPVEAANYTRIITELNYTATDTVALSSCWYSIDAGANQTSYACGVNVTGLTSNEGFNRWIAYANDTSGTSAAASSGFWVDSINPTITINIPLNQTYTNNQTELNMTCFDVNPSSEWYSIGSTNYTSQALGTNFTGVPYAEGSNTIVGYCNDTLNQMIAASRTFYVDSTGPTVVLNTPGNGTISTNTTFNLTANITDNFGIENATLFVYNRTGGFLDRYFFSTFIGGTLQATVGTVVTFVDGIYDWFYEAYDELGNSASTENHTITIDSTAPVVTIPYPVDGTTYRNGTVTGNGTWSVDMTVSDLYLSSCWFLNNTDGANVTVACGTNLTMVLDYGTYTHIVYANDTSNSVSSASATVRYAYAFFEESQTYSAATVQGALEDFEINVTYDSSDWSAIVASLNYNNTIYTGTKAGTGDSLVFSRSINVPSVASATTKNFNWTIGLTNSSDTYYFNSSTGSQSIDFIDMGLCNATYNVSFMNFTVLREDTLAEINGTIDVTFEYKYLTATTPKSYSFSNDTGSIEYDFCMVPGQFNYSVSAILEYAAPGYVHKFYNFGNLIVTNATTEMNLYLLNTSASSSFIIELKDSSYLPIVDAEVHVQRYDTGSGDWITTEIVETNTDGEAIGHVLTEDTLYRFEIYEEGDLIYTTVQTTISCPVAPCTVTIIIPAEFGEGVFDYGTFSDLTSSITYDKVTHIVSYTYDDTSTNFTEGRLNVIRYSAGAGYLFTPVCNTTSAISSAVITCDISAQVNGTYTASGYIKRTEGELRVERSVIDKLRDIVGTIGVDGVLWSIFLLIGILMLGVYKPSLGILFAIVGLIGMRLLGLMEISMTAIVAVVGVGGILLWQLKNQ